MGIKLRLAGDPAGQPVPTGDPTATVERRARAGVDDDGNVLWRHDPIIVGARVVAWESRQRKDRRGNRTGMTNTITLYAAGGFMPITEGDTVRVKLTDRREERFTVDTVSQGPQVARLTVRRTDHPGEVRP